MKRVLLVLALCLLLAACGVGTAAPTAIVVVDPSPTLVLPPTWTPAPTNTPPPTRTPAPTATPAPEREDRTIIRDLFDAYRRALAAGNGEQARALVSEQSIAWYNEVRNHAFTATREELEQLSLAQQLVVLTLRHHLPMERLNELHGESAFILAVKEGWIGQEAIEGLSLGRVEVGEDEAWAYAAQWQGSVPALRFVKERGAWKLDLTTLAAFQDAALTRLLEIQEAEERALLLDLLSSASERPVDERIFEGPLPASEFSP